MTLQTAVADLRARLDTAAAQIAVLTDLLIERDAQIRMVLEDKFFRPVISGVVKPTEAKSATEQVELDDVTRFPAKGDQEAIEAQDKLVREAAAKLERDLAESEEQPTSAAEPEEISDEDARKEVELSLQI